MSVDRSLWEFLRRLLTGRACNSPWALACRHGIPNFQRCIECDKPHTTIIAADEFEAAHSDADWDAFLEEADYFVDRVERMRPSPHAAACQCRTCKTERAEAEWDVR